ncbi:hypothetical protein VO54_03531 [Elizabethkingia miricola]|nr:hypothetical protein VO54_03531 [Elizabethkingia miricola]
MKTYFTLFSFACATILSAQKKELISFPTSAEAYSLSKVEKMPMDYFRGKANINIPIYTITVDGVSIPISLSYNTGGIKLNEVSSIVGLGWSLNIPGNIQHEIKGASDFSANPLSKNINDYDKYRGVTRTTWIDQETHKKVEDLEAIMNGIYDTKPDIFNYSLPTISGAFILQNNNVGSSIMKYDGLKGFTIPNEDISIVRNQGKFNFKDPQGAEYWMSTKNLVESFYDYKTTLDPTLYNIDSLKINNKLVKFSYNKLNIYKEQNFVEIAHHKLTTDPPGSYYNLPPLLKYEKKLSYTVSRENLINKIVFDNGEINFFYSDDPGMALSDGTIYRKDLEGGKGLALRNIQVKNKSGVIIKDITLNQNYFETKNTNKTHEDYRLKLVSIHDNLQNNEYKFTYDEEFSFPRRNSNTDDYWGYINNLYDGSTGLPEKYTGGSNTPPSSSIDGIPRRSREPNPIFAKIGSLKSIQYPTGAKKNFYYEQPYRYTKLDSERKIAYYSKERIEVARIDGGLTPATLHKDFVLDNDFYDKIYAINKEARIKDTVMAIFNNSCENESLPDGQVAPIEQTRCLGSISFGNNNLSGSKSQVVIWPNNANSGSLSIWKGGDCNCNASFYLDYEYPVYVQGPEGYTIRYSGLRISKIEDIDQNNVSNVYTYLYGKYDGSNNFNPITTLNQPVNFSTFTRRHIQGVPIGSYDVPPGFIEQYMTIQSSSQNSNAYGSSDVATYPYVIEKSEKGSVLMEFSEGDLPQLGYNRWKAGRLKKETYLNAANEVIKTVDYVEKLSPIKNSLSGYTVNSNVPYMAAFYTNFDVLPIEQAYDTDLQIDAIESAKIENVKTITKEFLDGKVIETSVTNNYSDTNINNPINIQSTLTKISDGSSTETTYQYAHEKGNQYLIDKNMIGIPLQTTVTQKQNDNDSGKTISKSEILYPTSQADANAKTAGLALPVSVLGFDLQNPNDAAKAQTELTYDLYDNKGNILQYSVKGKPVTVIWGYNQTQPIAKIEGAAYNQVSAYVQAIVAASDADNTQGTDQSEHALVGALDILRNNTALSAYQITTYTYNPLIGVTSITPPSGIREIYKYDSANRLESVKDVNGNLLKEYQYRYKN